MSQCPEMLAARDFHGWSSGLWAQHASRHMPQDDMHMKKSLGFLYFLERVSHTSSTNN